MRNMMIKQKRPPNKAEKNYIKRNGQVKITLHQRPFLGQRTWCIVVLPEYKNQSFHHALYGVVGIQTRPECILFAIIKLKLKTNHSIKIPSTLLSGTHLSAKKSIWRLVCRENSESSYELKHSYCYHADDVSIICPFHPLHNYGYFQKGPRTWTIILVQLTGPSRLYCQTYIVAQEC